MDLIDAMYANEMWKRETSHSTYLFQMQQWVKNDPYTTENAWKYEVYAWLRTTWKKIPDITEEEIEQKADSITKAENRAQWLHIRALILSEFYGMPLRIAYDRDSYEWIPDDKFRMIKKYGKVDEAYYRYQAHEQWDLDSQWRIKQLEPAQNNTINKVDIDVTDVELEEWNKILKLLETKLKDAQTEEDRESIQKDIWRAKKAINDLSSKK